MDKVLISFLIMFIVIGLLARFFDRYAAFWYRIMVADKLELVHSLLASGDVPSKWRIGWIESRTRETNLSPIWRTMKWLLGNWYLYRLNRLMASVHSSSVLKKQEKSEYLEGLSEIWDAWNENFLNSKTIEEG